MKMRILLPLSSAFIMFMIISVHSQDASNYTVSSGGQTKSLSSWFAAFPNLQTNVAGTGQPGMILPNGFFIYNNNGAGQPALRVQRDVTSAFRGTGGFTYKTIWGLATTNRNSLGYEWGIVGEVNNTTDATTGAQNVGVNGTIFKKPVTGYQVGPSWGGNFNCTDESTQANPVASCIGAEINSFTNATGTDLNRQRVGVQIAMGQFNNRYSTPTHLAYGILMGSNASNVIVDRAISLRGAGNWALGLDTATAKMIGPAVYLSEGQRIAFDGGDSGGYNRSLRYQSGILAYQSQNGNVFQLTDSGVLAVSGSVQSPAYRAADGTVGVSCNGPPTAAFRVQNGIVTNC